MRLTAEQVADLIKSQSYEAMLDGDEARYTETALLNCLVLIREHLIESPEANRERFERWFSRAYRLCSLTRDGDDYLYPAANDAWRIWQASQTWRGE